MKLLIEDGGNDLLLRAETPSDLDALWRLTDPVQGGPFARERLLRVPAADLGFDHAMQGECWMCGDDAPDARGVRSVGAALRLRFDWLIYREPPSAEWQLRAETASRLGHGLLNAFELVRGHS